MGEFLDWYVLFSSHCRDSSNVGHGWKWNLGHSSTQISPSKTKNRFVCRLILTPCMASSDPLFLVLCANKMARSLFWEGKLLPPECDVLLKPRRLWEKPWNRLTKRINSSRRGTVSILCDLEVHLSSFLKYSVALLCHPLWAWSSLKFWKWKLKNLSRTHYSNPPTYIAFIYLLFFAQLFAFALLHKLNSCF